MPSLLLSALSGGSNVLSGAYYSGDRPWPVGGVQARLHPQSSGNAYWGLSGGIGFPQGGFATSGAGSGLMDGFLITPGDAFFVPRSALFPGPSYNSQSGYGSPQLWLICESGCSGQARLFYEGI